MPFTAAKIQSVKTSEVVDLDFMRDVAGRIDITSDEERILARSLKENKNLRSFMLCRAFLSDRGAGQIAEAIEKKDKLVSLSFDRISVETRDGLRKLMSCSLARKQLLQEFTFKRMLRGTIHSDIIAAIADGLKHKPELRLLDFEGNQEFGIQDTMQIAASLTGNTKIRSLNFSDDRLGLRGAEALAKVLEHNQDLRTLSLSQTMIGDEGASKLASVLVTMPKLRSWSFMHNEIGIDGGLQVLKVFQDSASLRSLGFFNSALVQDRRFLDELVRVLEGNVSLVELRGNNRRYDLLEPYGSRIQAVLRRNAMANRFIDEATSRVMPAMTGAMFGGKSSFFCSLRHEQIDGPPIASVLEALKYI